MTIEEYLNNLCKHTGLTEGEFSVSVEEGDDLINATIKLPESESGLFIGYHGENLQSLQRLIRVSFYEELEGKIFKLNVNDYREQRQEQLEENVVSIARRVLETGEPYTFSYLTAHDRYIVHSTLGSLEEFSRLTSESEGEGKYRYLTIKIREAEDEAVEVQVKDEVEAEIEVQTNEEFLEDE